GYGMVRAVDPQVALDGLRAVLAAVPSGRTPVVHCCAPGAPLVLLRRTGADLALDTGLLGSKGWESVAVALEDGRTLYAGCVPTTGPPVRAQDVARTLVTRWHELGLPPAGLGRLVVTPACGLAGLTPQGARGVQQVCIDTARELAEQAEA
ncbi:MAG: methionine synthase, partial [Lapillicoccus sp.]